MSLVNRIRQDMSEFSSLAPQIKFLLGFQLSILFVISVLIGLLFSPSFRERTGQKLIKTQKHNPTVLSQTDTALYIKPADTVLKIGEEAVFTVVLDGSPVTAADIVLNFDPEYLEVVGVDQGEIFDTIIVNENNAGTISYSATYSPNTGETQQTGKVFSFRARALKRTEGTQLEFVKKSTITARGGKNTLKDTNSATVRIFD